MAAIHDAAAKVRDAIKETGPRPDYHWTIMARHRKEWPTLWTAVDELLWTLEMDELDA